MKLLVATGVLWKVDILLSLSFGTQSNKVEEIFLGFL